MADLPRWEYIVIILCGEVIIAVIVTLIVCWRCRWAKQDKNDMKDEKKPLPYVDELMDDIFNKDDDVVVGHAPLRHYETIETNNWIRKPSKKDEAFPAVPIAFTNSAFNNFESKKSNITVLPAYTSDKDRVKTTSKPKVIAVSVVSHPMTSPETPSTAAKVSESTMSVQSNSRSKSSTGNTQTEDSNKTDVNDECAELKGSPAFTAGNAIYVVDNQFLSTNHQPASTPRESSRLTPVDFEMTEMESPNRNVSTAHNRHSSPLVVRSMTDSAQIFDNTSRWRQFNRDLDIIRSPPPSYHSATGRRTNPRMGEPANLIGDDDDLYERGPGHVRFQPITNNRIQDLKYI